MGVHLNYLEKNNRTVTFLSLIFILLSVSAAAPNLNVNSAPDDLVFLTKTYYVDSLGYSKLVGEIINQASTSVKNIEIVATFYDSANNVIATDLTYTELDTLAPGQKSPYEVSTYPAADLPVDHYTLTAAADYTDVSPYRNFIVQGITISYDNLGYFHIVGEVVNTGQQTATYTKIVATFYDSNETVIGYSFTYAAVDPLSSGATSPFEVSTYPRIISPVYYELQVECNQFVSLLSSSITCQASKSSIVESDTITIHGSITPALAGEVITLIYTKPNATIIARSATTLSDGSYSDVYQPDAKGSWTVKASWSGSTSYQGSISQDVSFEVTQGGSKPGSACVVATATYGSAMAPQVQALRDFRETIALKTFAGSSFMTVFNSWYYSWSPTAAAAIAPSDPLRAAMMVVLQPILNILQVATATFYALSFNSEFAIVMAGFVAAALIGLIYFAPFATLAFIGAKRLKRNLALPCATRTLRLTAIPLLASLALIAIAELALSPVLMMVATGAFVILTIVLTAGTASLWLASLYRRQ
jgi:hypothetical protein